MLQSWNTANPGATADRVLGVVDQSISQGASAGCAEGMAAVNSSQAWVRVNYDQPGAPSTTGSLMGIELAHTLGAVPETRDDPFNAFHSPNRVADPSIPKRAYNVTTRSFLVNDRTVMTLSDSWNNNTTLLEPVDYAFVACRLGGAVSTDCSTSGGVGSSVGVPADSTFVISGTINRANDTADILESYFATGVARSEQNQTSTYRLIQKRAGSIVRNDGVPVVFRHSEHDEADAGADIDIGLVSYATPFNPDANRIELWKGSPGGANSVLLYARDRNGAPSFQDVSSGGSGTVNFTNNADRNDAHPALSPDGEWLAWSAAGFEGPSQLFVAPVDDPSGEVSYDSPGFASANSPAWSPDGNTLAYEVAGDIRKVSFADGEGGPSFGTDTLVYSPLEGDPSGFNPTWSPNGNRIAFEGGGDILSVLADGTSEFPSIEVGNSATTEGDPSWSATAGENRIAFTREREECDGEFCFPTGDVDIYTIEPDDYYGTSEELLVENGFAPSWGTDGRIAFTQQTFFGDGAAEGTGGPSITTVRDPGIYTVNSDGTGETQMVAQTAQGQEGASALAGDLLAWERYLFASEQNDIFLSGQDPNEVTVTGAVGSPADEPEDLRLDVFYDCGGILFPIAVGILPSETTATTASFSYNFDSSLTPCASGTLIPVLSDGLERTVYNPAPGDEVVVDSTRKDPQPHIDAPDEDELFLEYQGIALRGHAHDAEDGVLSGASLRWFFDGALAGTGGNLDLSPPAGGWDLGTHTVELRATDSDTNTVDTSLTIEVLPDNDNDGLCEINDPSRGCFPTGSDNNPRDAFDDFDGDGIPNIDDPQPTTPETDYTVQAIFDPKTLSLSSTGTKVTMFLYLPYRNFAQVTPSTVRLSEIAGRDVSANPNFRNVSWIVNGSRATAKFDRQKLIPFLENLGIRNERINLTIEGTAPTWSFEGTGNTFVSN
jgi:hypothetical protein